MSTLDGPLGTAPGATGLDLKRRTLMGTPPVSATTAGQLGLAAVLLSALLLCFAAVRTNVLLPESIQPVVGLPLAGPLAHLSFHLQSGEVIGALVLMFIGYVVTVRHAEHLSPRLVIGVIGVFIVVVLLAPPLLSTDVFSYQEYARIYFHYRLNPYTNSAGVLYASPLNPDGIYGYVSSTWLATPTVYGPLFTLLSGAFQSTATPVDIAISAYAYKAIAAISCAAICWMLWRMAKARGVSPVRAVALFGLNPLIVLYGVGGGHNDLLMMLFATAGIWAMLAGRPRSSGALVITSAAVKLTGALFLPFALAAGSSGALADSSAAATSSAATPRATSIRRRRLAFGAALAIIVWLGVGVSLWGHGLTNMIHTLRQVQKVGGWQNVPGFFSTVLGWQQISSIISTLFGFCFALVSCRLLWRVYRHDLDWLHAAGWATFALLIATSSIQPWYICWLVVPLALCSSRRMWVATAWLTGWLELTVIMGYLPHAPNILGI